MKYKYRNNMKVVYRKKYIGFSLQYRLEYIITKFYKNKETSLDKALVYNI